MADPLHVALVCWSQGHAWGTCFTPDMEEDQNMAHAAAKHRRPVRPGQGSICPGQASARPLASPPAVGIARLSFIIIVLNTALTCEPLTRLSFASVSKCFTCVVRAGISMRCKGNCLEDPVAHAIGKCGGDSGHSVLGGRGHLRQHCNVHHG